jgi:hypothetical protein
MYFGRRDKTPIMLEVEPEDKIMDAGDMLAKDKGSDSNDKPPATKSVTSRHVLTKLQLRGLLVVHNLYPRQLLNLKLS